MPRIAVIQGHPDAAGGHFCNALADAYARGADAAGHELRRIEVAELDFPLLRSQIEYRSGELPVGLRQSQADLLWADHYLIVYPLWAGTMPALLKGFLEQIVRPELYEKPSDSGEAWSKPLRGKSARVIVTMGMPALLYRWYFGAHGLKNLERSILGFVGIKPVRATLIGLVDSIDAEKRQRWLRKVEMIGQRAR